MNQLFEFSSTQRVADVLRNAEGCCSTPSTVSLIEIGDDQRTSQQFPDQGDLEVYFNKREGDGPSPPLRIWLINGTQSDAGYHVHFNPHIMSLIHDFDEMTSDFLVNIYDTHDWTILPTRTSTNSSRGSSVLQYGFWEWGDNATHAFTQRVSSTKTTSYFCVNFPKGLQDKLLVLSEQSPTLAMIPHFIDLMIIDHMLGSYRQAVSSQRSKLQTMEQGKDPSSIKEQAKTLHTLAVIWHILVKDLTDIKKHIDSFTNLITTEETPLRSETLENLRNLETTCQFWLQWSTTYLERTQIRINLMHHLAGQEDNRLNHSISKQAEAIAQETRRDGVWMSTLTVITAIFLPGSFVSSVLGMNVFSFDGTNFVVSSLWWIFPFVTIVLTGAVAVLWFLSSQHRAKLNPYRSNGNINNSGSIYSHEIDPEQGLRK